MVGSRVKGRVWFHGQGEEEGGMVWDRCDIIGDLGEKESLITFGGLFDREKRSWNVCSFSLLTFHQVVLCLFLESMFSSLYRMVCPPPHHVAP